MNGNFASGARIISLTLHFSTTPVDKHLIKHSFKDFAQG